MVVLGGGERCELKKRFGSSRPSRKGKDEGSSTVGKGRFGFSSGGVKSVTGGILPQNSERTGGLEWHKERIWLLRETGESAAWAVSSAKTFQVGAKTFPRISSLELLHTC